MGLLRALVKRFDPPVEQRALTSWDLLGVGSLGVADAAGQLVSPQSAEHALATVSACVQGISSAIASLPAYCYRWEGKARVLAESHPLQRLIDRGPNAHMTWADFVEWLMASVLLRGNGCAEIVVDGAGRLAALLPLPWDTVSIVEVPRGIAYDITNPNGGMRRLLASEVFHLRDRSDDGIVGVSRLQRAAGVFGAAQALNEFTAVMWRNGMHPSGALEAEGRIDMPQRKLLQAHFREMFAGTRNAAKILILDQALKWKSLSVSPEDAELLESRKFTVVEICRLFGVPPPLIQDYTHNTFTNSEQASRWFAGHTLGPWIAKLQLEAKRSLFTAATAVDHELGIDMSGLLRGDPELRWRSHQIAIAAGVLTVNEVREQEGWPPLAEGMPRRHRPATAWRTNHHRPATASTRAPTSSRPRHDVA
jgi:HK97 family phage portal protein